MSYLTQSLEREGAPNCAPDPHIRHPNALVQYNDNTEQTNTRIQRVLSPRHAINESSSASHENVAVRRVTPESAATTPVR